MATGSVRERALRGGVWLTTGSVGENGLRVVRTVILTRFLAPEAFGLVALVLAFVQLFDALTQVGIREAIIHSTRGRERAYLNAAQLASIARALLLCAAGWISVPALAWFYGQPELVPMLRVALIGLLLNGATSVRAYALQKDLHYGRWVVIWHGGAASGVCVAIALGIYTGSAWALVLGFVAEGAGRCLLSHLLCPLLPSLAFERRAMTDLLSYSRGYLGTPLIAYLTQRIDIFVLGKVVSAETLGLYSVALGLAQLPVMLATAVVNPILLPTLAQVHEDRVAFGRRVLRSTRYITLGFLPLLTLMAATANLLLGLLYGPAYAAMDTVFALLCLGVAVRVMGWSLGSAYLAGGVPRLQRVASLIRFAAKALTVVPLALAYGVTGVALAGILPHGAALLFNLRTVPGLADVPARAYLVAVAPSLLLALFIGLGWGASVLR